MSRSSPRARYRREFLRFLAGSPLLAYGLREAWAQETAAPAAKDVLSVLDFEALARPKLPPAHWGYMASGTDDNLTLQANAAAYQNIQLRPRRLVDVSKIDTSVELFGQRFASPIFVCPVGGLRMFHADGELAAARAARAKNTLQVLSTMTSIGVEEVKAARGDGLWYQLYMPSAWEDTEKLVRRVEAAGCPVLVWTIDLLGGRNMETATRLQRTDTRQCVTCHATATGGRRNTVMFSGLSSTRFNPSSATWDWVGRLKKMTSMKIVIKGVETGEDARLARETRRRRHHRVQPRRPRRRKPALHHRRRSGGRGRGEQPDSGPGGRGRAARVGRLQGARRTAPAPSASGAPTRGDSRPSARKAWSASSTS